MFQASRSHSWCAGGSRFRVLLLIALAPIIMAPKTFADELGQLIPADELSQWIQTEKAVAASKLIGNILSNGAVIASPSRSDPDYYFHWVRDGALTMDVIVSISMQSVDPAERQRYIILLTRYLDFSLGNQVTSNPSSDLGRGLGEPKFNTDGSAFTGPWGRPQDDGPALRALTFIRLANRMLDGGDPSQVELVKTKLYDGVLPTNSLIKRDLEYVSNNWQRTSFDLWEEVRGLHFYTRMVQRKALTEGARLAIRLNDGGAAGWYALQAAELEDEIKKHWDQGKGYLVATLNRDGGIDYKSSGLDTAIILGVLHSHTPADSFFSATNDMVLATAGTLASQFDQLYAINKVKKDSEGGELGIAIGRYPEDRYSGTTTSSEGNAWVLCTLALGELYYRAANEWVNGGEIAVTDRNKSFFSRLNSSKFGELTGGKVLKRDDSVFQDIVAELRIAADRQLRRVKFHEFADGSLSEQFNRNTGLMQSAGDLTWNYASVLTSFSHRSPAEPISPAFPSRTILVERSRSRAGEGLERTVSPAEREERVLLPANSLNRGGIPIRDPNADRRSREASDRSVEPATSTESRLRQRIAELEKTIAAMSRELRERKRAEREAPKPR
jgi:glucoamylase